MEQNTETDTHICIQLPFDKWAKATQWKKDSFFNKRCWNSWSHGHKNKQMKIKTPQHKPHILYKN